MHSSSGQHPPRKPHLLQQRCCVFETQFATNRRDHISASPLPSKPKKAQERLLKAILTLVSPSHPTSSPRGKTGESTVL